MTNTRLAAIAAIAAFASSASAQLAAAPEVSDQAARCWAPRMALQAPGLDAAHSLVVELDVRGLVQDLWLHERGADVTDDDVRTAARAVQHCQPYRANGVVLVEFDPAPVAPIDPLRQR